MRQRSLINTIRGVFSRPDRGIGSPHGLLGHKIAAHTTGEGPGAARWIGHGHMDRGARPGARPGRARSLTEDISWTG